MLTYESITIISHNSMLTIVDISRVHLYYFFNVVASLLSHHPATTIFYGVSGIEVNDPPLIVTLSTTNCYTVPLGPFHVP
jgi:hypothetical protein